MIKISWHMYVLVAQNSAALEQAIWKTKLLETSFKSVATGHVKPSSIAIHWKLWKLVQTNHSVSDFNIIHFLLCLYSYKTWTVSTKLVLGQFWNVYQLYKSLLTPSVLIYIMLLPSRWSGREADTGITSISCQQHLTYKVQLTTYETSINLQNFKPHMHCINFNTCFMNLHVTFVSFLLLL